MERFFIFGDNIVECDRFFSLIVESMPGVGLISFAGTFFEPTKTILVNKEKIEFVLVPGFGRRENDIFDQLNSERLILRETADIFFAKEESDGSLTLLLALEFCSALHAGNQAWQRQGRGYALGLAGVPYLYVSEIGGLELGNNREAKAARLPNPSVPYSFIEFTRSNESISIPIYRKSPEYQVSGLNLPEEIFGENILKKTLVEIVTAGKISQETTDQMVGKMNNFILHILSKKNSNVNKTKSLELIDFQKENWKKKISIPITEKMATFIDAIPKISFGINDLPICVINQDISHDVIIKTFSDSFPNIEIPLRELLLSEQKIGVVLVAGFKPRGDDSRPDRGLLPLARMLLGPKSKLISIIYGPMKREMVDEFTKSPQLLANHNGLIQSVFNLSDLIVANPKRRGLAANVIKGNFEEKFDIINKLRRNSVSLTRPSNMPITPGEHDVDTAIHTIFTRNIAQDNVVVFEGLCNPPGGDWAGISLQDVAGVENRWISLPRVTDKSKRPDHVIQLFTTDRNFLLIIESKEKNSSVEDKIGERLKLYIKNLLKYKPSMIRKENLWMAATEKFEIKRSSFVTAAAYLINKDSKENKKSNWKVDFAMEFFFNGRDLSLRLVPLSEIGQECCKTITNLLKG